MLLFYPFLWHVLILDMHFTLNIINMHSINSDNVNSIYMHLLLRLLIFYWFSRVYKMFYTVWINVYCDTIGMFNFFLSLQIKIYLILCTRPRVLCLASGRCPDLIACHPSLWLHNNSDTHHYIPSLETTCTTLNPCFCFSMHICPHHIPMVTLCPPVSMYPSVYPLR